MTNHKESDILNWIEQSMEDEKFAKKEIVLTGTTGKTDGYASDIIFANVSGVDAADNNKEIDLAIKMGKQNKNLREQFPMMKECYLREILVYDRIFPAFEEFQNEKKVVHRFEAVPKCYKTFLTDDSTEVLVFENLRKRGFKLHIRDKPMNLEHIKLVLDSYARFHAISFAFKDQKAEEYKALTAKYYRHNIQMFEQFGDSFKNSAIKVVEDLKEASRNDLAEKYDKILDNNSLIKVLKEDVASSVITHGDCHNNNFVFQYKDSDEENPTSVMILDWQVSIQHSPVMDVAYFLYAVAGENIFKLSELLEFYHSNLAHYAKEMGTDLSAIYPFASLIKDWRRYSLYGFQLITIFLEVLLVPEQHAPSLDSTKEGTNPMEQMFCSMKLENRGEYWKRLIQIVDQYCNHQV